MSPYKKSSIGVIAITSAITALAATGAWAQRAQVQTSLRGPLIGVRDGRTRSGAQIIPTAGPVQSGETPALSVSDFGMIDFPRAGVCVANAVNAKGRIVGGYGGDVLNVSNHGFLLQGSTFKTIDYPQASGTEASGINDHNVIVGWYADAAGNTHGFQLASSKYTVLDAPAAVNPFGTIAWDINKSGQIVGGYWDGTRAHGFLLSSGVYTTLDPPGSISTTALGINASGQVVGWYADSGDSWHGFLLSNGTYTTVDYPGHATYLFGINDNGQIVGAYDFRHGFIYQNGQFTSTDVPFDPAGASYPSRLNNKGELVGVYIANSGTVYYGYNATVGP